MLKRLIFGCFLMIVFCAKSQDLITFSAKSGKYTDSIQLFLEGDFDQVYYTTDGSKPTKYSNLYKDYISINTTTHLKLRLKKSGKYLDTLINKFYLINFTKSFPVLAISIPKKDLWSEKRGIFVRGENAYRDSNGRYKNCNYHKDWEKKVTMMYFEDSLVVNQQCGMKIFGESTRANQDKSFKLIAREKYGNKLFNFPFFTNKSLAKHKQLVVRASGNDYRGTRFRDVLSAKLVNGLGVDYMDYQPIHLFVNGTYWGVYNLREKINEHYFKHNKGIPKDSVNLIMGKWVRQQGSAKDFLKMYKWFYKVKNMDSTNYCIANDYLDIRNYINFRIFQLFINNADSRGNIRYWNSPSLDGRFRMVLYDTDHGFGTYNRRFLAHSLSANSEYWYNPSWSTRFLRKLMLNKKFKNDFLVQYSHLLNTNLNKDTILAAVAALKASYQYELPRPNQEIARHLRRVPLTMEKWEGNVEHLNQFAKLRYKFVKKELLNVFNIQSWFTLSVKGDVGRVSVNDNAPLCLPYEGEYLTKTTFSIYALDDGNFSFVKWSDGDTSRNKQINSSQNIVLVPEYEFKEIEKPVLTNTLAENNIENQQSSFSFSSKDVLFWLGLALLTLGTLLTGIGIWKIKKARLSGL